MDIRLCSSRNDREEAAAAMKNKSYYIPQATERERKTLACKEEADQGRKRERKKQGRRKERGSQTNSANRSGSPHRLHLYKHQQQRPSTDHTDHIISSAYSVHPEHWYHACDKTALQTETAAVVYPLPSRRLRPQSPTAASPPPRGLAQHHRPDAVTLVAQPAPASQGCGMGVVSSVRHLGPRYYTGCMLSTALSVRDLSVCTQLSTHIHNISPDY